MTEFTRQQLKVLRTEMQSVLLAHDFGDTINLEVDTINVGNCKYSGGEATYQVKFVLKGGKTKEQQDLEWAAKLHGIDTTIIAKLQGEDMSIIGYKTRARKKPWILQRLRDGAEFVAGDNLVKQFYKKREELTQ
jgi:hypothetical protein